MSSEAPTSSSNDDREAMEVEAAVWLSLRDRGMSPDETAEFMRWLQADARHAELFAELDRTWREFNRMNAVPLPGSAPDPDLLAPRSRTRPTRPVWIPLAAAALLAMLLVAAFQLRRTPELRTEIGAFQKVDLPDGTVVQLNSDSALETHFSAGERRLRLVRGEAHFEVAKDPARPFIVDVGPVAVRAVGTAFNVRRREAAVEVLVTEGRVSLATAKDGQSLLPATESAAPPVLTAGDRAIVEVDRPADAGGPALATLDRATAEQISRTLAWRERRLEFEDVPLAEIAAEFNRYNREKLVIADPALGAKRFSGTFRADSYGPLVRLLEENFGVTVVRRDREILLQPGR